MIPVIKNLWSDLYFYKKKHFMDKIFHVHDILHYLQTQDKGISIKKLIEDLRKMYGENCHFTTCGDHLLSVEQAIDFILLRKKAYVQNGHIFIFSNVHTCD